MKQTFRYLLTFFLCSLLFGCAQVLNVNEINDESAGSLVVIQKDDVGMEMNEEKFFVFKFFNKAPETTENKPIDDVIKIFFHETSNDEPYEAVAIDIENSKVYDNPSLGIRGVTGDFIVQSDHAGEVYDILEKYQVTTWETEYIVGDPGAYEDGYSWRLMMQFADGTVKTFKGNDDGIKPDNFDAFSRELHEFSKDELEKADS